MLKDYHKVVIDGKSYLPIDDLIEELEKQLSREKKDLSAEDLNGFEIAEQEALIILSRYIAK